MAIDLQQLESDLAQAPSDGRWLELAFAAMPKILQYGMGNLPYAAQLLEKSKAIAQDAGNELAYTECLQFEATLAFYRVEYDLALSKGNEAIARYEKLGHKKGVAEMSTGLGMAFWDLGDYARALDYIFKSLAIFQELGNHEMGGVVSYMIGSFYLDLKEYKNASEYFNMGYELASKGKNKINRARCMIGIGNIHLVEGDFKEALTWFGQALAIQEAEDDPSGISRTLNDIGKAYRLMGDWAMAEEFYRKSEEIRRKHTNKTGLITTLMELGELFVSQSKYSEALSILEEARELTEVQRTKAKLFRIYRLMSDAHKGLGNLERALHYFQHFYDLREEVMGEEFSLKMKSLERRAELEKKEKEAEIYRLRNVELKDAYERIDKKNRDITASINYAKRIQDAMLPSMGGLSKYVKEYFVLFMPRDIVSGDFYWFAEVQGKAVVSAVDCTGHGVPGAFMSMVGMNLLSQIVQLQEETEPHHILSQMHILVQEQLKQADGDNKDGMDMAICTIEKDRMAFAGAKNPLIFIQKGELFTIKGGKWPIGGHEFAHPHVYEQHEVPLLPGNCYYLLSDGFEDQFGGEQGKKFKQHRLKELLLSIHRLPMQAQETALRNAFSEWKGHERQIDDVLVIGFRV